jgi:hypothetical protein
MADKNELKIHESHLPQDRFETAVVKGVEYVRDPEGNWRHADSWIKVPGGRDWTLTERFNPKFVIANTGGGGQIERVVVSGDDIEAHPDLLGWCLEKGYSVFGAGGEEVFEVMVPWAVWHDHDRIPGMIYAPELHGSDAERELAEAERKYREADRTLAAAAAKRAEVLRRHSEDMTRQQARLITDLSVGRIQQLIREGVDHLDQIDRELLATAELRRPKSRKELHELTSKETGITYPTELIRSRIINLVERGLLRNPRGKPISLTPEGRSALTGIGDSGRDSEPGDD